MKQSYLFTGISVLLLYWAENVLLVGLVGIVIVVYYWRHYNVNIMFFCILFLVLIRLFYPVNTKMPTSYIVQVKEIKSKYIIGAIGSQKVIIYQAGDVNFNDVIKVNGKYKKIEGVHNFSMFYFPQYMKRRNITYQLTATSTNIIKEGKGIRNMLFKRVSSIPNAAVRSWIKSMVYGIHEEDMSFFVTSSGMHISFLFQLLQAILCLFFSKTICTWFAFFGMGILGYATTFTTSLQRMLCFRSISFMTTKYTVYDRVGISMIVTLIFFPFMAFELAFLIPVGFRLLTLFNVQKRSKYILNYLLLVPIQYQFFHVCNPLQILVFKFLRSVYSICYICALFSLITQTSFLYFIYAWIIPYVQGIERIGFHFYYTPHILWLLFWMCCAMKYLSYRKRKDTVYLSLLFLFTPFSSYFDPFGEILMIDVGQGDCTFIRLPFHQGTMLIDVMGSRFKNIPADIIVPVLKAKGVHRLDKIIITHEDFDHSGGLEQLQELMEVDEVIRVKQKETTLHTLKIPFLLSNYKGEDANEDSIITLLEVYGLRVLFMGDAGHAPEEVFIKEYPKLEVDVLKVGHHGSKTSSSPPFIHQIRPKIGLISCGRNNTYGHPNKETLDTLRREGVLPLISAKNGAVSIKFTKYFSFYETAEQEFGIIKFR